MRFFVFIFVGFWLSFAAQASDQNAISVEFTVADGYVAHEAGDYVKARHIMETLAAAGDAHAMNGIGRFYDMGKAYLRSAKLGCKWYEKSANAGYIPALYNMTFCFKNPNNGEIFDHENWIYWMEASASSGDKFAQFELVKYYIRENEEKAFYWAKKAAAQGNAAARVTLWQFDQDQGIDPVSIGEIICVVIKLDLLKQYSDSCD